MSKEKENIEPGLVEAKKLIVDLFHPNKLESYGLTPRKLEIVKMKWNYGLSNKQVAEKLSITEGRVKEVYDSILYMIFHRMRSTGSSSDMETLKEEVKKLKAENEKYKKKFAALSAGDKAKFKELDIVVKSITDIGLSKNTSRTLEWPHNIKTVYDLLQYRLSSLLLMDGIDVKMVEEIERFTIRNRLKMKK